MKEEVEEEDEEVKGLVGRSKRKKKKEKEKRKRKIWRKSHADFHSPLPLLFFKYKN